MEEISYDSRKVSECLAKIGSMLQYEMSEAFSVALLFLQVGTLVFPSFLSPSPPYALPDDWKSSERLAFTSCIANPKTSVVRLRRKHDY